MSGLKLQYLSNPSTKPSFVIGNPSAAPAKRKRGLGKGKHSGIAKSRQERENEKTGSKTMAKRKHRKHGSKHASHRKHGRKSNPTEVSAKKGKRRIVLGTKPTRKEFRKLLTTARAMQTEIEKGKGSPALQDYGRKARNRLIHAAKKARKVEARLDKLAGKMKKKGWKIKSRRISAKAAIALSKKKKHRKAASKKKSHAKKRKHVAKKVAVKVAKPKRHRKRKHVAKKAKHRKAKREHAKKRASRKHGKRKGYWSKRRHPHHLHVSVKGLRKGSKRKRSQKVGKKTFKLSVFRKNPEGGSMLKKVSNFLTAGDPKQAGMLVVAAALSQPVSALALKIPGLGKVLNMTDSALAKVSPQAANAITPILPTAFIAALLEVAGAKMNKPALRKAGAALMITNIVSIGASIGDVISSATGLQGVDFTLGRSRRGMRGVDFTRTGVGAIPAMRGVDFTRTGVGAIPALRGLTAHDRADFGRSTADFGAGGETIRSAAGTYKTPADFGAVPAVSAMRGYAHTADVMGPDDDGQQNPEESADHMI
jgi:hypothetical protein